VKIPAGILFVAIVMAEAALAGDQFSQAGTSSPAAVAPQDDIRAAVRANTLPPKANSDEKIKPFFLTGLDGVKHSLAEWKGKVVVLNFWATWCSPCLYEIRDFVTYQKKYKTRGLQIIGLGLDEEKKLRNVQRTLQINYPVLIADPFGGLMKQWGNGSGVLPYTVVIDRDGQVAYAYRGQMNRDVFDEYVLPLLDKV
jgi:peroxiredoxin